MTIPAAQEVAWHDIELYGGAMKARLPLRFKDISNFRPVPDHQEVWADGASDQSIVVEVVEHAAVCDADVGRFVFDDMAAVNDASSSSITGIRQLGCSEAPHMPEGCYMCLVQGQQQAAKGRDGPEASNLVEVSLCVIRLPQHGSDLLVSVNAPTYISPGSSAAQHTSTLGEQPAAAEQAAAVMQGFLNSLEIEDYSLFGA